MCAVHEVNFGNAPALGIILSLRNQISFRNILPTSKCETGRVPRLQFLLMDTPSQVWFFILQYLDSLARRNLNLGECLNFLFQLSFSELGKVS